MTTPEERSLDGSPLQDPIRSDPDHPHATAVFSRDAASVGEARVWLTGFLRRNGVPGRVRQDAILIVSELVTNALRHGLGEIVARSSLSDHAELRIAVTDSGNELPVMQPVDPDRVGGVGLHIVEQLATQWGIAPFPGGKTVWATLAADSPGG